MTNGPRRTACVIAAIVATLAAAAAAPALAGGQSGGSGGAGAPAAGAVPVERGSLCQLRAHEIRELRSGLPDGSSPESLRDAVWLLQERIAEWESAAEGLPQAMRAARSAAAVEAAWREALQHHDAGNTGATRSSLANAEARLLDLERQLTAAPIPGCP